MCKVCETESFFDETYEDQTCLFGCGFHVDPDTLMCPRCKDHSAPSITCPECGTKYQNWVSGTPLSGWERD